MAKQRIKQVRRDGVVQHYTHGKAPAAAKEAIAKSVAAPSTPLAPAPKRDFAALVTSPGQPTDSRVDKEPCYQDWGYRYGLSLDRRTGETTWWETEYPYYVPYDGSNGHIVGWAFAAPVSAAVKWKTFEALRMDMGRLVSGYETELDDGELVARNADDGTDWFRLELRIDKGFYDADDGAHWADDQIAAEVEATETRVTVAVNALTLDGVDKDLYFNEGEAYVILVDRRTGKDVFEQVDSTNVETIDRDLRLAVTALNDAVEEHDANEAWEDDDE